ncbi:hypothetical protein KU406_24340, partial [Salmonella enterica subsp. enterica serovar Montevideo]|nr:hypothetical protein [Salmonella enterica subsp. enterica serovar Montevideo]
AKAGGDVDAIQAATPVTLNMALANRRTMEENAALLMGMKSAFLYPISLQWSDTTLHVLVVPLLCHLNYSCLF